MSCHRSPWMKSRSEASLLEALAFEASLKAPELRTALLLQFVLGCPRLSGVVSPTGLARRAQERTPANAPDVSDLRIVNFLQASPASKLKKNTQVPI